MGRFQRLGRIYSDPTVLDKRAEEHRFWGQSLPPTSLLSWRKGSYSITDEISKTGSWKANEKTHSRTSITMPAPNFVWIQCFGSHFRVYHLYAPFTTMQSTTQSLEMDQWELDVQDKNDARMIRLVLEEVKALVAAHGWQFIYLFSAFMYLGLGQRPPLSYLLGSEMINVWKTQSTGMIFCLEVLK